MAGPNNYPIFVKTPLRKAFYIATANTARDGTGAIETIVVPGEFGCRVDWVLACSSGVTTAGNLKFFIRDEGNWRFIDEISVTAITPSATVNAWDGRWTPAGGYTTLLRGQNLGVATHNAEAFLLHPEGGHF